MRNIKKYCYNAKNYYETIIITRKNDKNIVLISEEEYKKVKNIKKLIKYIKNKNKGIKNPEVLKYDLSGYWSMRIIKEHRFIYKLI